MTIKSRIEKLEGKTPPPVIPDRVIVHSDLPEGVEPTGVIRIIEHVEESDNETGKETPSRS